MRYGDVDAVAQVTAENADRPAVPDHVTEHSVYLGRLVFQKSGASALSIISGFETELAGAVVTDHGELTGLSDDDHTQYVLEDGSRGLSADWDAGNYNISSHNSQ